MFVKKPFFTPKTKKKNVRQNTNTLAHMFVNETRFDRSSQQDLFLRPATNTGSGKKRCTKQK